MDFVRHLRYNKYGGNMLKKIKWYRLFIITLVVIIIISGISFLINSVKTNSNDEEIKIINLVNMNVDDAIKYIKKNKIEYEIIEEYNDDIAKDKVIYQSIKEGIVVNDKLTIKVSLGPLPVESYQEQKINELGRIPVMMYHGIQNMKNSDTSYIGGNIDKDGYNRTTEAFRNDLEFYYQQGYRMIRLNDYINGSIDVAIGKSPIVLTFDDGSKNNINVTGLDNSGNIIIDPNSAIGILEEFKHKYPDYNITATFFLNIGLFGQPEYNDKILKWLIEHNYDIGNHTSNHVNFSTIDYIQTQKEVATMYQKLDQIIPNKYVKIVALPNGSPYKKSHQNFDYILNGSYNDYSYKTEATLRVGWESDYSPFSTDFDKTFIKRIRAYDNNGSEFDIEMNFKMLESKRYISDGNKDTIVIKKENLQNVIATSKTVISY